MFKFRFKLTLRRPFHLVLSWVLSYSCLSVLFTCFPRFHPLRARYSHGRRDERTMRLFAPIAPCWEDTGVRCNPRRLGRRSIVRSRPLAPIGAWTTGGPVSGYIRRRTRRCRHGGKTTLSFSLFFLVLLHSTMFWNFLDQWETSTWKLHAGRHFFHVLFGGKEGEMGEERASSGWARGVGFWSARRAHLCFSRVIVCFSSSFSFSLCDVKCLCCPVAELSFLSMRSQVKCKRICVKA